MADEVLLVDFENVPGTRLEAVPASYHIIVFGGAQHRKMPRNVAAALQALGERMEWRQYECKGPNAVDFFIACELGRLQVAGKTRSCVILSNDRGFDPLLKNLSESGMPCRRVGSLPIDFTATKLYQQTLEVLEKCPPMSRPRKRKTLAEAISLLFDRKLKDPEIGRVIDTLILVGKLTEKGRFLRYTLGPPKPRSRTL